MPVEPPLKILVTLVEPPDPSGNASARWYHAFLGELCRRGHTVTALASIEKPEHRYDLRDCRSWPNFSLRMFPIPEKKGLLGKLAHLAFPFRDHFSPEFHRAMRAEIARGHDLIHLEQTWCGWLALRGAERSLLNVHYLRSIDTARMPRGNFLTKLNHALARRAERKLIRRFPNIRVLSSRLAEEVRKINPRARVHEVNFGMDFTGYRALPPSGEAPTIGIMGNMEWYPSYSAANVLITEVWPRVKRMMPEARLLVFGWSAGKKFAPQDDVEILENVPAVPPVLSRMQVFVCPNYGATGTKTKIIESMLYGIPVVTTPEGLEGLAAAPGVHAEVGETYDELAAKTVALLRDPARRARIAAEAERMVRAQCSPARTVEQLEGVYRSMRGASP